MLEVGMDVWEGYVCKLRAVYIGREGRNMKNDRNKDGHTAQEPNPAEVTTLDHESYHHHHVCHLPHLPLWAVQ